MGQKAESCSQHSLWCCNELLGWRSSCTHLVHTELRMSTQIQGKGVLENCSVFLIVSDSFPR